MRLASIFFVLVMLCLSSCGKESAYTDEVTAAAESHAKALIEAQPMSDMQLQQCLLKIRSNEQVLRETGHEDAANRYIERFETVIRESDDSLAVMLKL